MAYLFNNSVGITVTDTPIIDAFGRMRTSAPTTIFDSQLQYDKQPLIWDEEISGSATSVHVPAESAVDMSVTASAGDRVIRQTKEYFRYQPGKSHFILMTGVFGAGQTNTQKLWGIGDDNNGVFVGQDGGGMFVLLRSSSGGTVDDSRKVYQTNWSEDTFDGNGLSQIVFDPTKTQIALIDLEWLGVGRVRIGFVIDGFVYYVHHFNNANNQTTTYMTTANLPLRYEIYNTGTPVGTNTMKSICAQLASEGGVENTVAYPFAASVVGYDVPNGAANAECVFAAQHLLTFNGVENRGKFNPIGYDVLATGGTIVAEIVYNPTLTGGTWDSADSDSIMEYNTGIGTGISGGIVIDTLIVAGGQKGSSSTQRVTSRLPFGIGINADTPIPLAMRLYSTTSNNTADVTVRWEEIR